MVTWDSSAWLEYKKGCIGRDGAHKSRIRIWENDLAVYREGGYTTESGKDVSLEADVRSMLDGTRVYDSSFTLPSLPDVPGGTETGVGNVDCIALGDNAVRHGFNPVILNFSGIDRPNGMVAKGYKAQEESICRRSNLAQSLSQYYTKEWAEAVHVLHKGNRYPLDSLHGCVYSPGVTVFRTGEFLGSALLEEPFRLAFISTGAIKKRDVNDFGEEDTRITRERIRTVFRVGLDRGHDSLILGAWGCGAFKNPVDVMASLFKEVGEEPEFRNRYRAVWFACMEKAGKKDPAKGKFAPFYNQFGHIQDFLL